jgi:serine/threonine-protein kinase
MQARRIRLEVSKSGYRTDEQTVELPGGEVTELRVELRRATRPGPGPGPGSGETAPQGPGQLTFDARPWCQVSIDGSPVGQTPIVNRTLPSGSHRITCTNPDLGASRTLTVQIRAGETTRQRIDLQ